MIEWYKIKHMFHKCHFPDLILHSSCEIFNNWAKLDKRYRGPLGFSMLFQGDWRDSTRVKAFALHSNTDTLHMVSRALLSMIPELSKDRSKPEALQPMASQKYRKHKKFTKLIKRLFRSILSLSENWFPA